ncbi:Pycsar system effector family protein [Streptomyces sp. NPDC004262]
MTETPPTAKPTQGPNADHAWKALGLVVDWIKHAEAKAGATLAATGVSGGVLYNLVKDVTAPSTWLILSAMLCALSIVGAGFCAGLVLWPRLRMKEAPNSLLYFHHIARSQTTSDTYATSLIALTQDVEALVAEIAQQGWANARVAHKKFIWGGRAIRFLLLAFFTLAITTALCTIN